MLLYFLVSLKNLFSNISSNFRLGQFGFNSKGGIQS